MRMFREMAIVVAMSVVVSGHVRTEAAPREPSAVVPKSATVHAEFKRNPLRLKSGAIGRIQGWGELKFARSDDEGTTWSTEVQISEPHVLAYLYSEYTPIVTHSGRIIVPVYRPIGRRDFIPEKAHFTNVALQGDNWAHAGSHAYEPNSQGVCFVYYSDDEGETWQRNANDEMMITLDYSAGGHWSCTEPTVVEYSPKHLLMLYRTSLGRLFQSWSSDDGTNWTLPRPSQLAAAQSAAFLRRIPGTNDLLVLWNQASGDEIERGLQRHRLSSAISQDGGATWKFHKNVVCLDKDDRSYVEPPPVRFYAAKRFSPRLPPNFIMSYYPHLAFWNDRVHIHYFENTKRNYDPAGSETGRITISLPFSWFYAPRADDDFNRPRAVDSATEHLPPPPGEW